MVIVLFVAVLCLVPAVWPPGQSTFAETPETPGESQRGIGKRKDRSVDLSEQEDLEPPSSHESILPPVPPPPEKESGLSSAARVHVHRIDVIGNTVFTSEQLAEVTSDFENRIISSEELEEVRHRLTLYYVNQGYINSGAIVPDQQVTDGIITIQIVEGQLTNINVTGNKRIITSYIAGRISRGTGPPLNINVLQETLQILEQDPRIRQLRAQVGPGPQPGEGVLDVTIVEDSPFVAVLEFSNERSPRVGGEQLTGYVAHANVTGRGDTLEARYDVTDGLDAFFGRYTLPFNARNSAVKLFMEKNDATVVESPLDRLDILGESLTYGVTLSHPVMRRPNKRLDLALSAEKRHSESYLLGEPFSYYPGIQRGESDITVLRFSQDWVHSRLSSVFAVRSVVSWGIDAFGATVNESAPDGRFLAWLYQVQYARRLAGLRDSQLVLRMDGQLASDSLLPMELFPIGGAHSVRGYREYQLLRDNGLVASAELRIPTVRLPLPKISKTPEDGVLRIAPFVDVGGGWNTDLPTPDPRTISSVGLGLRWDPSDKIHSHIYWGIPLRDLGHPGNDLQDSGIHFLFSWRVF